MWHGVSPSRIVFPMGMVGVLVAAAVPVFGQSPGIEVIKPVSYRLKIAVRVEPEQRALTRIKALCPVPIDWREQTVKLIRETVPRGVKSREQTVAGMGKLWVLECPRIPTGQVLEAERIYEVQRSQVVSNLDPQEMRRPKQLTKELREYLRSAPGIDVTDRKLQALADELGKAQKPPWKFTEDATAWIRKNVHYELGSYRGAKFAYEQRRGDCEDLSALLIALCRIADIPARTVWVEGHAYPEFYLEDAEQGYWIPVQLHGPEAFGSINETKPILQKGDQFRDPMTRQTVRYLPQQAIAFGGRAKLAVTRTILSGETSP